MGIGLVGGLFDAIVEFIADFFGSMFDVIPKSIYLLAAVFLSVVDVLQCLVRKLAGLDVYWTTYSDGAIYQQDPLTEFIYGILGYGNAESVAIYKGLNSVFLSLAVFAVICLVVTSMIAIIKSHYNEDVAGTNPWKYIYTAIKAVFTFAIVPFVTVIGLKLSSWMLQTLDGIVAGSATEEAIKTMYGNEQAEKLDHGVIGSSELMEWANGDPNMESTNQTQYYGRYDMFGMGLYTSSTPFSGMLFKACGYSGNRARNGYADGGDGGFWDTGKAFGSDPGEGIVFFGGDYQYFFGAGIAAEAPRGSEEQGELVAQQVDYAFMNNLRLTTYQPLWNIRAMDAARYFTTFDIVMPVTFGMNTFSKFHVGLVWEFYDLWQYNYIVAFAGGTTMVGIMLSVIIGLMSRLLKSAILFLIYPSLLGIAPLDNFKAFKSWTTQFIQQVMMAFGAIIGMNLTLLILPYANNFKFFNIGLVDALVNCIIVITGLMMMKDIIAMISNFAGGADANAAGSALKGEVGKAFAGGAKTAGKLGLKATKAVGTGIVRMAKSKPVQNALRGVKRAGGDAVARGFRAQGILNTQNEIDKLKARGASMTGTDKNSKRLQELSAKQAKQVEAFRGRYGIDESTLKFDARTNRLHNTNDLSWKNQTDLGIRTVAMNAKPGIANWLGETGESLKNGAADAWKRTKAVPGQIAKGISGFFGAHTSEEAKDGYLMEKDDKGVAHYYKPKTNDKGEYVDKDGKVVTDIKKAATGDEVEASEGRKYQPGFKGWFQAMTDDATMGKAGKNLADGFLKGLTDITSNTGLDKMLKGMSDIFKEGTTFKGGIYDKSDKKAGDDLNKQLHDTKETADKARHQELLDALKNNNDGGIKKSDIANLTTTLGNIGTALGKIETVMQKVDNKLGGSGGGA